MDDLLKNVSTELALLIAIIVNQSLSMFRTWLSKKTIKKDVQSIKKELTVNGGNTNTISDRLDRLGKKQEDSAALLEAYFTIMMNRDDEALFRADESGLWIFCNNKVSDIFGMYHRDMLSKGWEIAIGRNITERYEFVRAWNEFVKDGSPLNHQAWIKNQETQETKLYLITASKVVSQNRFQFFLGKIQAIKNG